MTVLHRVTGFDKRSEMIEREFNVPTELVGSAREIAEAPADWRDAPGAFELSVGAVRAMSALLKVSLDVDRFDWFLEPVAVPAVYPAHVSGETAFGCP